MGDYYFDESVIFLDLEGETKEEVLSTMAKSLQEKGIVKESYIDAILSRENSYPTGLPTGGVSVAIPHTDVVHVNIKSISIGVLKKPVEFFVMGGVNETTPVKLVFMLAMDQAHSQLGLLQRLMPVFHDEQTLNYLANEENKTNIKNLLADRLGFNDLGIV